MKAAISNYEIMAWMKVVTGGRARCSECGGYGVTTLEAAVSGKSTRIVQTLLLKGADANGQATSIYRRTALQAAVEISNVGLVHILLAAGAE
jgi:hypothetical protein